MVGVAAGEVQLWEAPDEPSSRWVGHLCFDESGDGELLGTPKLAGRGKSNTKRASGKKTKWSVSQSLPNS